MSKADYYKCDNCDVEKATLYANEKGHWLCWRCLKRDIEKGDQQQTEETSGEKIKKIG